MSQLLIPYSDQIPEGMHGEFMRKIADQLAKDLHPWFSDEIPTNPQPDWIMSSLLISVERLICEKSNTLGQVLYRIDLSEGKINELMSQTGPNDRVRVLAGQILEREAKKGWMRMHYSS